MKMLPCPFDGSHEAKHFEERTWWGELIVVIVCRVCRRVAIQYPERT